MSHHTEATNKIQVNNYGIPEPFYENFASINDLQAISKPLLVVIRRVIEWDMERDFMMNY